MSERDKIDLDAASERVMIEDEGVPDEAGWIGVVVDWLAQPVSLVFIVSALVILYEVVMRYAFNAPTLWGHETTTFLSAIGFIFGGLYAVSKDRHIRVVLLYDFVPKPVRRVLDVVISFVSFCACVLFSYAAWLVVERAAWNPAGEFRLETSGSAWNPPYPGLLKIFLFAILVVMAVQFLVLTIRHLTKPKT